MCQGVPLPEISELRNHVMEQVIHSFIVKIWREEPGKGRAFTWRGYITHVPDNERHYLTSLGGIGSFIRVYLQQMGVTMDFRWRVAQWLKRRTRKRTGGGQLEKGRH